MQDLSTLSDEQLVRLRAAATGQTAPQQPQQPLRAPPRVSDPYRAAEEQRAQSGEMRANTNLGLSIDSSERAARGEAREEGNVNFTRFQALRDDFERNPTVQNYNTVISQYASALNTAPDAAGDLALIYSFAKVMDPASVVRESEMEMVGSTSNTAQQIATRFGFEIGANGRISPETRTRLLRELHNRAVTANQSYNQFRNRTREDAQASGVDPERVVGPHAGLPYFPRIREYLAQNRGASSTEAAPAITGDPRQFMTPDDFETGYDRLSNPSPQNMPRLSIEQEASWAQFVRDNQGRMTPELLEQWYASNTDGWQVNARSPDARKWIDALNAGERVGTGIDYSAADQSYLQQFEDQARESGLRDEGGGGIGQSFDAFMRGAADTATLGLADEIAGVTNTVFGGGTYQENVDFERYIDQRDNENNFGSRLAGQVTGGIVGPGGRVASAARTVGPGRAAIEGAALGGAYGVGSGTDLESRIGTGIIGAGTGAGAGVIGNALSPYVARGVGRLGTGANALLRSSRRQQQQIDRGALLQDFADQGVDALPANIGGPNVNRFTSVGQQSPISGDRVITAFEQQQEQFGNAVTRAAAGAGRVLDSENAGNVVRQAGNRYIKRTKATSDALYSRAERMVGNITLPPRQALQVIDGHIARLSETGNTDAALLAQLNTFRSDLQRAGGLSINGLRRLRTRAREVSSTENLRGATMNQVIGDVQQAIAQDIEQGLVQAGKTNAAQAFRNADNLWRQRVEYIDQTLEPLIGRNRSGEQILSALNGMTTEGRGNAARLRQVLRGLDPQELGDIQATIVNRLGRARAGAQDAEGEVFSPLSFLTNWNNMTPQARAALFPDGQLRSNIGQLARIADSVKDTAGYANRSNTGGNILAGLLTIGLGSADLTGGALALGGQFLNGRMMTSPAFTRWLARAPRNASPSTTRAYIRRLDTVAAQNTVIAADVRSLQQQLLEAFAQSPSRAAASGQEEQDGGQIPPQP